MIKVKYSNLCCHSYSYFNCFFIVAYFETMKEYIKKIETMTLIHFKTNFNYFIISNEYFILKYLCYLFYEE